MRVLLDENLPRRLKNLLPPEIEGETVRERGWGSIKNGALFDLIVVVLIANRNDSEHLSPLMQQATEALCSTAAAGEAVRVVAP